MDPTDVVILSHNRLDHLRRTIDALTERTPEPIRLTIVDNASGPEVRNWLADNRDRFERILARPTNERMPAFQHGIEATTSDPFVLTDPDLLPPKGSPSWLARLRDTMARHPDFAMVGVDFDEESLPWQLRSKDWDELRAMRGDTRRVDGDLYEGNVGTALLLVRRAALTDRWIADHINAEKLREAGWRVGWNPEVRAHHLGSFDHQRYPEHLARKNADPSYASYDVVLDQVPRAPRLVELAMAGPIVRQTREAGVPDTAVLEVAWGAPALGPAVEGALTMHAPSVPKLPLESGAAGAVVLLEPPADAADAMLAEACRVATGLVMVDAKPEAFGGRLADQLAPPGWRGREQAAAGEATLALARAGERAASVQERLGLGTLQDREAWLRFFAAGAFGAAERRLFAFDAVAPAAAPAAVRMDPESVALWQPEVPSDERRPAARRRRLRSVVTALRGRR